MIKSKNYITIQGWMTTDLGLKGNSLIIYAIIYGFCQDGKSCYNGSLEYLQSWTNSTRQGVILALKNLVSSGMIIREDSKPNNKYYVSSYYVDDVKKVNTVSKESLPEIKEESKESLHNNIDNINNNIINKNIDKYSKEKDLNSKVALIIEYFNKVCGTRFRPTSAGAKKVIKARLNDGATLQDFYDVIDFKWKEWGEHPKIFSGGQLSVNYLRPSTLFGTKMEEYLQQAWLVQSSEGFEPKSADKLEERSNLEF